MPPPEDPLVVFRGVPRDLRKATVRAFAARLVAEVAGGRRFTCLLTGDAELQRLNRDFLGHDYPTDVLSFPGASPSGDLGDLAISCARAAEQARAFGHALEAEVSILMLHGTLHLLGYDHETDRGRMARAEEKWRGLLGLPDGLIERARAR
jgi:probable rRNA maturation factor